MKLLEELAREKTRAATGTPRAGAAPTPSNAIDDDVGQAIAALYSLLADLAEGLSRIDAGVPVDFDIPSVGPMKGLRQRGYAVLAGDAGLPQFAFAFDCVGEQKLTRVVGTVAERDGLVAGLEELGLLFGIDSMSACRFAVSVRPVVHVRLEFAPTRDGQAIRLTARNLNRIGTDLFTIRPEQVSGELVEELGKLLLRRSSRFPELTGNVVSAEARARLRARLEASPRRGASRPQAPESAPGGSTSRGAGGRCGPRAQRRAPILIADGTQPEGWVDWARPAAAPAAESPLPEATSAAGAPRRTCANGGEGEFRFSRFAWVITTDLRDPDAIESLARRGPPGTARAYPTSSIVKDGMDFRLIGDDGEARYRGMILGTFLGSEPLYEFGRKHGCVAIDYLRNGAWVREP